MSDLLSTLWWLTLLCFAISGFWRLLIRIGEWAKPRPITPPQWNQWETPVPPPPRPRTLVISIRPIHAVPPDTMLRVGARCCICGGIDNVQLTKAAYTSEDADRLLNQHICKKCQN